MLLLTVAISLPLFHGLAGAGAFVESLSRDELSSMGVERRT